MKQLNYPLEADINDGAFMSNSITKLILPKNIESIDNESELIQIVDRYTFIVESTKVKGSYTIDKGYCFYAIKNNELQKDPCYAAKKDNYTGYGKTIEIAIENVEFKIYSDKIKKEPIYLDTIVTDKMYKAITGYSKFGIKHYKEQNNITKKSYTVAEILPILEKTNAYGLEIFRKLIRYEKTKLPIRKWGVNYLKKVLRLLKI